MVTYGPWVQDPDYLIFWTQSTNNTEDYEQDTSRQDGTTGYNDPVIPITFANLQGVFSAAQAELDNRGGLTMWLNHDYGLVFPNWISSWSTWIWRRVFPVTTEEPYESSYNPWNHGYPPPEGAIGLQFIDQPYDPEAEFNVYGFGVPQAIRLGAVTRFEGIFDDSRVVVGAFPWATTTQFKMATASGEVTLGTLESETHANGGNWFEHDLGETIDLTGYGATEPGWAAEFWTETHQVIAYDFGPYNNEQVSYGWLIKRLRFEADMRPPLYRWVFPGEDNPYRRVYPRDDARAGGSPRTFPQSRAQQASNRIGGGYL